MHFLFFAAQYLPTVGGVERYTYNLTRALARMGHSSTIITSALKNLPEIEIEGSVKVVRLDSTMLLEGRFPVVKRNKHNRDLMQGVLRENYDLAVINTRFYPLSLYGVRNCFLRNIPSIVIEHGSAHLSLSNRLFDLFVHLYEHITIRQVMRYCNEFYGVSLSCCEWLKHFGIVCNGTLYNAIDVDEVHTTADSSQYNVRKQFSLNENTLLILFGGRFLREKGIIELLEAYRKVTEVITDTALILVGDGPLYEEVEKIRSSDVYLTGRLSYPDSLSALKQSDVFILPTYSEGFSTITLEAAAFGRCIVSTYTGGNAELIDNMKSGILLEEVTSTHIVNALNYVLSNNEFRISSGEQVKQRVTDRFSWKNTADKLLSIAQNR